MESTIPRGHRPAPDPNLTTEDLLRSARELVPILRERAAETDRERRVSDEVFRRIQDAGLFHILKPPFFDSPK